MHHERFSWDEALTTIASRLTAIAAESGPEAVVFGSASTTPHDAAPRPQLGRGESGLPRHRTARPHPGPGIRRDTRLASPHDRAAALVVGMVQSAPPGSCTPDELPRSRPRPAPLHPESNKLPLAGA
jgi:hypothetical protein